MTALYAFACDDERAYRDSIVLSLRGLGWSSLGAAIEADDRVGKHRARLTETPNRKGSE